MKTLLIILLLVVSFSVDAQKNKREFIYQNYLIWCEKQLEVDTFIVERFPLNKRTPQEYLIADSVFNGDTTRLVKFVDGKRYYKFYKVPAMLYYKFDTTHVEIPTKAGLRAYRRAYW